MNSVAKLETIHTRRSRNWVYGQGPRSTRVALRARYHPYARSGRIDLVRADVPRFWARSVAAPQLINYPDKGYMPIPESGLFALPFYNADAPRVQIFTAGDPRAQLGDSLYQFLFPSERTVRFFVDPFDRIRSGLVHQMGWGSYDRIGARTTSLSTVSFSPLADEELPFDVKTDREAHHLAQGLTYTPHSQSRLLNGVRLSSYLEEQFKKSKHAFSAFLPEPLAMQMRLEGKEITQVIRIKEPSGGKEISDGTLLPAHSLLGEMRAELHDEFSLIDHYADRAGTTRKDWLNDFTEKLGQFVGHTLINMGIVAQIHGQNLMVEIDESTGRVNRFVLKDLFDVQIDAFATLAASQSPTPKDIPDLDYTTLNNSYHLRREEEGQHTYRSNQGTDKFWKALNSEILRKIAKQIGGTHVYSYFMLGVKSVLDLTVDELTDYQDAESVMIELDKIRFYNTQQRFFRMQIQQAPRATAQQLTELFSKPGQLMVWRSLSDNIPNIEYIRGWKEGQLELKILRAWSDRSAAELERLDCEILNWNGVLVFYDAQSSVVLGLYKPDPENH